MTCCRRSWRGAWKPIEDDRGRRHLEPMVGNVKDIRSGHPGEC